MVFSPIIIVGWSGHLVFCYFIIRPIRSTLVRTILTLFLCVLLTGISCHDLPQLWASSMFTIAICWIISIRLIHLTVFPSDKLSTFRLFLSKVLWILFPIVSCQSVDMEWPISFDLISAGVKLILNHWIYRWLLSCEPSDSYGRMLMFYLFILTIPYIADLEIVFVRIVTRNKYTLESFTYFTYLSRSLRNFWGRRYNRIVNAVLKESVFEPIYLRSSSATIAALSTFIISGLFHIHILVAVFDDISYAVPTLFFFFLHGIACCLEAHMKIQFPEPFGWLMTHIFLLLSSPLIFRPFTKERPVFFVLNPPPLIDIEWIPKLPVPSFCSK